MRRGSVWRVPAAAGVGLWIPSGAISFGTSICNNSTMPPKLASGRRRRCAGGDGNESSRSLPRIPFPTGARYAHSSRDGIVDDKLLQVNGRRPGPGHRQGLRTRRSGSQCRKPPRDTSRYEKERRVGSSPGGGRTMSTAAAAPPTSTSSPPKNPDISPIHNPQHDIGRRRHCDVRNSPTPSPFSS